VSEIERQISLFLEELKRENVSGHTVRCYASDLSQFMEYFSPPGDEPPGIRELDRLALREWLGELYRRKLKAVSMRRKVAALRSFFRFLIRQGLADVNVARLIRTPKAPKLLPRVMTAEQANMLLDQIAAGKLERPHPARDLAIFETLYGCGLRIGELVGLNVADLDLAGGGCWFAAKGRRSARCRTDRKRLGPSSAI